MTSASFMSPTPSTTTPSWQSQFEKKMEEVKPSKTDINKMVMNYLVTNGYPSAAKNFAVEANIQPNAEYEAIEERVEIRSAIHSGDIQSAIEKINELNPQILDGNPSLHFSLLRLQLVELIRKCTSSPDPDITPALDFATSHLAPRAPTNPQFLADLESTLSLLIFPSDNLTPALAKLLDPDMRRSIAARVNEAILQSQGLDHEAKLLSLVKTRAWAEQKAREAKKDLPDQIDIGLDQGGSGSEGNGSSDSQNGNGEDTVLQDQDGDPMVT